MNADSLARLMRNIVAATDETLVALANRGLVRRAAKDLESESPRVEETDQALLIHGNGWIVTMPPEGPSAATDNTPATGVTRQILAATMFLRDRWLPQRSAPPCDGPATSVETVSTATSINHEIASAKHRLVEAPLAELAKWAGRTPLLEASAQAEHLESVVADSPQLKVDFPTVGFSVVLITDRPAASLRKLLDQFKTTGPRAEQAKWVLQAILALKRQAGQKTSVESAEATSLDDELRADRIRVAERAGRLLDAIAASGIAHPSSRVVERLQTASVAAEAVRSPRLARLLASLASDAELRIARHASADPVRMLQRMVVASALAEAAARPENAERIDLFGRARSAYHAIGELDLRGLGAYGWRTPSGFEGLTTIFWEPGRQQFFTAGVARGEGQDRTFSIDGAYRGGIGWSGATAIDSLCRRRVRLAGAKANVEGRLSLADGCRATVEAPTNPNEIDFGPHGVSVWTDLRRVIRESQPLGLRIPDPRAALVVLRPSDWGERWFDELAQAFVWRLIDSSGDSIEARIPWTDVNEASVLFFEAIAVERDKPSGVLGRIDIDNGRPTFFPLAFFSHGTPRGDLVLCPQFDQDRIRSRNESLLARLREKHGRVPTVRTRIGAAEDGEEEEMTADDLTGFPPSLRTLLIHLDEALSCALETGTAFLNETTRSRLSTARDLAASLGLTAVAESITQTLGRARFPPVLRTAYRLHVLRQTIRLCLA